MGEKYEVYFLHFFKEIQKTKRSVAKIYNLAIKKVEKLGNLTNRALCGIMQLNLLMKFSAAFTGVGIVSR